MTEAPAPKRVLYVVSRFPSVRTTFIAHEMNALQMQGITVHVAAVWRSLDRDHPHAIERPFLDRLLTLHLAQPQLWLRALQQLILHPGVLVLLLRLTLAHLASIPALLKLFASMPKGLYLGWWAVNNNIDHMHAHFLTSPTTTALIASRASGIPFTATAHAFDIFEARPHLKNRAVRLKCESAACVIMISEFNHRFVQQRWPGMTARLEVLYNGIDLDQFAPRKPSLDPPPTRILSVGQLVSKKGHADLIHATARLIEQGHAIDVTIIGEGPQEAALRDLIAAHGLTGVVHMVGKCDQDEVYAHYQRCHIFALASQVAPGGDMDGLPTVLIEALAMERPVVSTQLSGIPEIVIDGETGVCVPPGDVDALANAIARLIDDPARAAALAKQGRALVAKRFDRCHNAVRLLQLWQLYRGAPARFQE